jgi:hypothetical protein
MVKICAVLALLIVLAALALCERKAIPSGSQRPSLVNRREEWTGESQQSLGR